MTEKMRLIERLVKDGSIDLSEALMLLEGDTFTKMFEPIVPLQPYQPQLSPFWTSQPTTAPHPFTWPPVITCEYNNSKVN